MNCSPTTAKTGRGDTRVLALTSVASPRLIPKEVVGANVTARSGFRARARLSTVVLVGEVRDVDPKREALEELAEELHDLTDRLESWVVEPTKQWHDY